MGSGDLTEAGASVAACDRSGDNPDSGLEPRRRGPGVSLRPTVEGAPAAACDTRRRGPQWWPGAAPFGQDPRWVVAGGGSEEKVVVVDGRSDKRSG